MITLVQLANGRWAIIDEVRDKIIWLGDTEDEMIEALYTVEIIRQTEFDW